MELRQIEGHPDYYINDLGQFDPKHAVLSTKERINVKKLLHWQTPNMGKKHLRAKIDNTYIGIHVLLAKAFIPNPENKPIVHHKDFNPLNNCLDNLMWVTVSEHQLIHHKGVKPSEETRKKISDTLKGNIPWNKGKPMPEETRKKISERNKGRIFTDEMRKKLCDSHPKRSVDELTLDDDFIYNHKSVKEASNATGVNKRHIYDCCNGKRKTAGKRKWRYAD